MWRVDRLFLVARGTVLFLYFNRIIALLSADGRATTTRRSNDGSFSYSLMQRMVAVPGTTSLEPNYSSTPPPPTKIVRITISSSRTF